MSERRGSKVVGGEAEGDEDCPDPDADVGEAVGDARLNASMSPVGEGPPGEEEDGNGSGSMEDDGNAGGKELTCL